MGYLIGNRFAHEGEHFQGGVRDPFSMATEETESGLLIPRASVTEVPEFKPQSNMTKRASSDISRVAPHFYDPRYQHTTLAIPTDERTLHGLYRFFDDHDPLVGNAIRMHTEFPLSDFRLGDCEDPGVQKHFEEMWYERLHGEQLLFDATIELWRIGNVFPFGAWNEADYMWEQFTILNPDYVSVQSTWVNQNPLITLQPDEGLKRVVNSREPRYIYDQLPPEIIRYVRLNQEIPLDPNNVFHIAFNKPPYEKLGKSIIKRLLRLLMYEDRLYQAQFAIATRHIVPLTVVKVGDPNTGWVPHESELEALREMFAAYELDPNFSIFYHYAIDVEYYGASGKILPTGPEFERIQKLKFIGMGINESLITGQGTYANAYASLQVLRQRYLNLQLKLDSFVHNGIFKPVAEAAGFYKSEDSYVSGGSYTGRKHGGGALARYKKAKQKALEDFATLRDQQDNDEFKDFIKAKALKAIAEEAKRDVEYIYPELRWGRMSMSQDTSYAQILQELKMNPRFEHMVSEDTIASSLDLDRDLEMPKVINEDTAYEEWAKEYYEETGKWPVGYQARQAGEAEEGGIGGGGGGMPPMPGGGGGGGGLEGLPGLESVPIEEAMEGGEPAAPIGEGEAEGIEASLTGDLVKEGAQLARENEEMKKEETKTGS